jgi:hypothetical protein
MVRYRVKPERVAENEALVRDVYAELERDAPTGLRYATFKLDDGVTFVHIAEVAAGDSLRNVAAFGRFREDLAARCDEPPVRAEMEMIGSYNVFATEVRA